MKCDYNKRIVTLTFDYIKRLSLLFLKNKLVNKNFAKFFSKEICKWPNLIKEALKEKSLKSFISSSQIENSKLRFHKFIFKDES